MIIGNSEKSQRDCSGLGISNSVMCPRLHDNQATCSNLDAVNRGVLVEAFDSSIIVMGMTSSCLAPTAVAVPRVPNSQAYFSGVEFVL